MNDRQYGFCCHSTVDFSVYVTHSWSAAIGSKADGLTVNLDMTKAFDRSLQNFHPTSSPRIYTSGSPTFLPGASRSLSTVYMPVNISVPHGCVLSPSLFLINIYDILDNSNICISLTDDSTVDAASSGRVILLRKNVDQCWNKLAFCWGLPREFFLMGRKEPSSILYPEDTSFRVNH